MMRSVRLALLILLVYLPGSVFAGSHPGVGVALDGFFPLDRDLYGWRMVGNSWGKDMFGMSESTGAIGFSTFRITAPDFCLAQC